MMPVRACRRGLADGREYHVSTWLTLELAYSMVSELAPEHWPIWAVRCVLAYRSDFYTGEECCGCGGRWEPCSGGRYPLEPELWKEIERVNGENPRVRR